MTSLQSFSRSLREILTRLEEAEATLAVNDVRIDRSRVWWQANRESGAFLRNRGPMTVEDYLHWLNNRHYSAVLWDGSLIQLSYDWSGGQIRAHRVAYIPCPYELDLEIIDEGMQVDEYVEVMHDARRAPTLMRSPIRFDFDPSGAGPGHPASHLTINGPECRIPCLTSIHPSRFIDFIFYNFYPDFWRANPWMGSEGSRKLHDSLIDPDDQLLPHLNWLST